MVSHAIRPRRVLPRDTPRWDRTQQPKPGRRRNLGPTRYAEKYAHTMLDLFFVNPKNIKVSLEQTLDKWMVHFGSNCQNPTRLAYLSHHNFCLTSTGKQKHILKQVEVGKSSYDAIPFFRVGLSQPSMVPCRIHQNRSHVGPSGTSPPPPSFPSSAWAP